MRKKMRLLGRAAVMSLMAALLFNGCASAGSAASAGSSQAAVSQAAESSQTAASVTAESSQAAASVTGESSVTAESGAAAENNAAADISLTGSETKVLFDGDKAEISGKGASFSDGVLTISEGGSYVLSGSLNGQVLLETGKEESVTLFLDGLTVCSEKPYAICSVRGKSVNVVLLAGTENHLTVTGAEDDDQSGEASAEDKTEEQEADAALYVKNDLVLSGSGSLAVESAGKAVHAKDTLTVGGGTYDLVSADDALNGKDGVTLTGGTFTVRVTDTEKGKGLTSRGDVTLDGADLKIASSNEGIEGLTITFNSGTYEIHSSDDGINAREKQDTEDERAKQQYNEKVKLNFNGGFVTVDSGGDGLDSNGDIIVNNGTVIVSSAEHDGDNAVDMNGECLVNGGVLLAMGMQGMQEPLSDSSVQKIVTVYLGEMVPAAAEILVKDASGTELLRTSAIKSFNCLQLSLPEFSEGETYTIATGEQTQEVTVGGVNTYAGERSGGFGGHGGFGGRGGFGGPQGGEPGEGFRGPRGGNGEGFQGPQDGEAGEGFRGPRGGNGEGFQGTRDGNGEDFRGPRGSENGEIPQEPQKNAETKESAETQ